MAVLNVGCGMHWGEVNGGNETGKHIEMETVKKPVCSDLS